MTPPTRPVVQRRPSWLSVVLTSTAIFLVVLALLVARVAAGQDPVLGAQASSSVASASQGSSSSSTSSSSTGSSDSSTGSSSSTDTPTTSAS